MPALKIYEKHVSVRVTAASHKAFQRNARQFGRPSDILRELVEAFAEDRLTIKPSPTKRSIYHVD